MNENRRRRLRKRRAPPSAPRAVILGRRVTQSLYTIAHRMLTRYLRPTTDERTMRTHPAARVAYDCLSALARRRHRDESCARKGEYMLERARTRQEILDHI